MDRAFFERLSDAARAAIAANTRHADNKDVAGFDPVTDADRAAERALRDLIDEHYPDHGIWGEEYGWTREGRQTVWSLDPIDGTRAFICDLPSWAILVGLLDGDERIGGMIDLPVLGERLIAVDGATMRNDDQASVSDCTSLSKARGATTDPYLFDADERARFECLHERAELVRFGMDALAFARVATGGLDFAYDSGLKRHDYDALVPVVRGAGGHVGNRTGGTDFSGGDVIAAASEPLYRDIVAALS